MSKRCWIGLMFLNVCAAAQTTVTSNGGTTYRIPKFSGNYTLVDSVLSESNGDLLVGGTTGIQFSSTNQLIGTIGGNQSSFSMQANSIYDTSATGGLFFMGGSQRGDGLKSQALIFGNSSNYYPLAGTQTGVLVDGSSGVNLVGIGMASGSHPGAQLEVNGGIKLSQFGGGSIMFPDGSVQSTAAWSSANGTLNIGGSTGGWQTPALINIGGSNDVGMAFGTANYGTLMGSVEGNWFNILNPFVIQPGGRSPADHPIVLTTVQNSPTNGLVIQNSGNIGMGTISPGSRLEVNGDIRLSAGSNGNIVFPDGSRLASANGLSTGGYFANSVGIRTTTPVGPLDIGGVGGLIVSGTNLGDASLAAAPLAVLKSSGRLMTGWNASGGGGEIDMVASGGQNTNGFRFYDYTSDGNMNLLMAMPGNGNVGIGTGSPGAKLEISGSVKLTAGTGATITFQDGSVQAVAWNGVLSGGDYAESVDVSGDRSGYEPGDVLVIDPAAEGKFLKASEPYSTAVMGIYSTKPGVVGRRQKTDKAGMKDEVPMAMTGIVPTKVSAENGPIKPGDLLVTSSKPGYAMKGTDRNLLIGAVVGKALGHLDAGTGLIEAAVALQ